MEIEDWQLKKEPSKKDLLSILSDLEDKLIEYSTTIDRMHIINVEAPRQDLLNVSHEIEKANRARNETKLEIEKYKKMLRELRSK